MNIIGHGIDLVVIERIADMLNKHEQRFLDRCFTPEEQAYANSSEKRKTEILAARFAAKEAVLKAIGTGWRDGIAWTDIDVTRDPSGKPGIILSGEAKKYADNLGITFWLLSLTHTDEHAMASAIALC